MKANIILSMPGFSFEHPWSRAHVHTCGEQRLEASWEENPGCILPSSAPQERERKPPESKGACCPDPNASPGTAQARLSFPGSS